MAWHGKCSSEKWGAHAQNDGRKNLPDLVDADDPHADSIEIVDDSLGLTGGPRMELRRGVRRIKGSGCKSNSDNRVVRLRAAKKQEPEHRRDVQPGFFPLVFACS